MLLAALLASAGAARAAEQPAAGDVAQANNPLANFTAFNLHNYYIGEFTDADGRSGDQFWMRYARPFSLGQTKWLMRASLPVNSFPVGPAFERQTGVGDFNVIAPYLIDTGNPALSVGIGPQLTAPTATKDTLGSGKWSAGFVHVLFDAGSPKFQWGYLLSWQHSFAGDDDRATVNQAAFQPFGVLAARWRHLPSLDRRDGVEPRQAHLQRAGRARHRPGDSHAVGRVQPVRRAAGIGGGQGRAMAASGKSSWA